MSFIVIEGLDGSGKSTQVKMLCNYLTEKKVNFEYLHFPRTDEAYFGLLISRFLRGEMGDIDQVDPWMVAMLFAGDRWAASKKISSWIESDVLVVVDRYVFSNIAYQVAKVANPDEKQKLRTWIYTLEYTMFNIPKPDVSIWLDAPLSFVEQQLNSNRLGNDRDYLQGVEDIHETSINFQQQVYQEYSECCNQFNDLIRISCSDQKGAMMHQDAIFEQLINRIRNTIKELK
ncbi:MAG: dTMP kinase [Salinivirgaceae bacterium]|nr:dTMP kinase [Salinivirgaceae bacterium]